MATRIRLSERANDRWTRANRSGGDRHRAWLELNEAISVELLRREGEVEQTARADCLDSAQAQDNPPSLEYQLRFAVDVAHRTRVSSGGSLRARTQSQGQVESHYSEQLCG